MNTALPALDYIGDCSIAESEEPDFDIDDYGADALTRKFLGRADQLKDWLKQWKKKAPDEEFPQLSLVARNIGNGGPGLVSVSLVFKGLLDDDIPDPVVEGGWAEEQTQVGLIASLGSYAQHGAVDLGLGNRGGGIGASGINMNLKLFIEGVGNQYTLRELAELEAAQCTLIYRSPTTRFRYVVRKEPKAPKYGGVILLSDGDFDILDARPATFSGRPVINRELRTKEFEKRRVGNYWEVSEVTQGVLVSSKVAMRGVIGRFIVSGLRPSRFNVN